MSVDLHQSMREVIDKSLLGTVTVQQQQELQKHLSLCSACRQYLNTTNQVIAGLGGYSFELDRELQARVMASVALRAQQLAAGKPKAMWQIYLAVVLLTGLGCFAALRLSSFAITSLHVAPGPLQFGVLALWMAPSIFSCLLFPVMHRLSTEG